VCGLELTGAGLTYLIAAPVTVTIYFCEGEKDADTLAMAFH
jgi:hypothetical protein